METEEEDAEVVIARLETMTDAVTMPILAEYTEREYKQFLEEVQRDR